MDNMAYLQQIAVNGNNGANSAKGGDGLLSKLLNKWTFIIGGAVIILLIGIALIMNALNVVDNKDQELMTKSYWAAFYLNDKTFNIYQNEVKNSDIRSMTGSLMSVLTEISTNERNLFMSEYGTEITETQDGEIAKGELRRIARVEGETSSEKTLNDILEEGRLNGILDRTFLREITLQIAILISYQSECAERTKNTAVQTFSEKAKANLQNLYDQFYNFKSPTV